MRIQNTHKTISNQLVRDIVNFARPSGISNFDVMIKNSKRGYAGYAYSQGSGYHATANPFVVIRIGQLKYPYTFPKRSGYLVSTIFSETELIVHMLAHELRHLWQAKIKKGWRVWGAKGQFSERDADAYAIHKVREYRRDGLKAGE